MKDKAHHKALFGAEEMSSSDSDDARGPSRKESGDEEEEAGAEG